jgi:hypothetical protein
MNDVFDTLANDFDNFAIIDEKSKDNKILSTGITVNGITLIISIEDLLKLIEKLAQNQIRELRISGIDLNGCYNKPVSYIDKTYTGWTIKSIIIKSCILGEDFLKHILSPDSLFKAVNSKSDYTGKNLIEEIRIIECERTDNLNYHNYKTIRGKILTSEVFKILNSNYRVRIIKIKQGSNYKDYIIGEHIEFNSKINPILKRNKAGHLLCLSAIYTILLIKKYRTSLFDYLGKDVVKLICQLLLGTKGTKVWCQ